MADGRHRLESADRWPRQSLRPQLNQIRAWVRQGRTDAWIAHQLGVSASQLRDFRQRHGLSAEGEEPAADIDLRDEIEAEIEAELGEPEPEEEEGATDEGEGDAMTTARARRPRPAPAAPPTRPPRTRPPQAPRGDLRPGRGGGLRHLARPLDQGRPDLHRALGGPQGAAGDDRARPDRPRARRGRRGLGRGAGLLGSAITRPPE